MQTKTVTITKDPLPKKIDRVKRVDLRAAWETNHADWVTQARAHQMSTAGFLNTISPPEDTRGYSKVALHNIMQEYGLRMISSNGIPSSPIEEFLENSATARLLEADMINHYEACMGLSQAGIITAQQASNARSTVGEITAGTAFNDYQFGVFQSQTRRGLKLRLAAILADTEEATTFTYQIPEYITPEIQEQFVEKSEETEIVPGYIRLGTRNVLLKKVAVALGMSYEFAKGNALRAQAIRRWTENTAIVHEKFLVQEALRVGLGDFEGSDGQTKTTKVNDDSSNDYDVETLIKLAFELPEDYEVDTVVGGAETLGKWLMIRVGDSNIPLAQFLLLNPDLNQPNRNINTGMLLPTQWAAIRNDIKPEADETLAPDNADSLDVSTQNLFFFDSRNLINYVTYPAQDVNENHKDPMKQAMYQIMSRWYGFYAAQNDARLKVKFA